MVAALDKSPMSFDEFLAWYPENSEHHYELRRGAVIETPKPKGKHSEIAGFVIKTLNNAIDQIQCPYFIPKECVVKISEDTGYEPDVAVIDRPSWSMNLAGKVPQSLHMENPSSW